MYLRMIFAAARDGDSAKCAHKSTCFGMRGSDDIVKITDMKLRTVTLVFLSLSLHQPAIADCYEAAANRHGVNTWVLKAIAFRESTYRPHAFRRNSDGSVDIGLTGTNSINFPERARHVIRPEDLYNPCVSLDVAARILRKHMNRFGNTWRAVGTYHSGTPERRDWYAGEIKSIIDGWRAAGVMPQ